MFNNMRQVIALAWDSFDAAVQSVKSNLGMAFFSLVLAFGLWLIVVEGDNTTRTGFFPASIPVEPASVPAGLALAAPIEPVTIRITAPEDIWSQLSIEDFRAVADLSNAETGENRAPVIVQAFRDEVNVDSTAPNQVLVQLGASVAIPVPVAVNLVGSPALGYEVEAPLVNPTQVTVTGAEDLVNQVEVAAADVNIFGITENVTRSLKLTPRDSRGLIIEGVSLEPDTAEVGVSVELRVVTSSYPITPTLTGRPAPGYNVTNITIEPPTATLVGSQDLLEDIISVSTVNLDITDATDDIVQQSALVVPPNLNVVGSNVVSVWVSIEAGSGEATFGVSPQWQNIGAGLSVRSNVSQVQAKLAGSLPLLQPVTPDQISVTVDVAGLGEGSYALKPRVQVPEGLSVISTVPDTLQFEIVPQ